MQVVNIVLWITPQYMVLQVSIFKDLEAFMLVVPTEVKTGFSDFLDKKGIALKHIAKKAHNRDKISSTSVTKPAQKDNNRIGSS